MSEAADAGSDFVVDFPTLGYLVADWIERHCIIPDGFKRGQPYVMADWQLWCTCNHYRVRNDAVWDADNPRVSTNFFYRRSQIVAPQKTGKGPWAAAIIACEALGPSVFAGWANGHEEYFCSDHGCKCGWTYTYMPGEPMGIPRPTPLIQLTATSLEQTKNVFRPLRAMFRGGDLEFQKARTGEEFIRLPDDGRIDTVTSAAQSKLGNPVTFVLHDESGIYTSSNGMIEVADTQNRGLAGMDARGIETTNPWNPAQQSTAQATFESPVKDIFRFYRQPPTHLNYADARDREAIHCYVYEGSWWVNLDAIEGLAVELIARGDLPQAERFYGNRVVASSDTWLDPAVWAEREAHSRPVAAGDVITIGFDGSLRDDSTALVACRVEDGYLWLLGVWECPEDPVAAAEWKVPVVEVDACLAEVFKTYKVERMYCDPAYWQDIVGRWASEFGEKTVIEWWTNRERAMCAALERFHTAAVTGQLTHDGNPVMARHIGNAKKTETRSGIQIRKDRPQSPRKIDIAVCCTLAYEARGDVISAGWSAVKKKFKVAGF